MSRLVSQAEIDALVLAPDGVRSRPAPADAVVPYNFRRPDRVTKDQIRSLHFLHERFARNATTSLAAFLRTTSELSIQSVEQFGYSEFLMALPDPTAFYAVAMPPFESLGALELNGAVAFAIVDRMLGGSGSVQAPARALTEIEQNVVDSVVQLLLEHLAETWRPVAEVGFRIQGRETRPQMLQVASWNEVVIVLRFDLKVAETRGLLHLCIPAAVIEASGSGFVQSWQQARREPTATEQQWLAAHLGSARLPVTADLAARLTTRELLQLAPGHVLNLGIPSHAEIDVRVADVLKFKGRLGTSGPHAVVAINRACSSAPGGCEEVQR